MTQPDTGVEGEDQALLDAATTFAEALAADPDLPADLEDVLAQYMDGEPDATTVPRLIFALDQVVGAPGGSFLSYYLGYAEPNELLNMVEQLDLDDDARALCLRVMRRLQALYGYRVTDAYRIASQNPKDWSDLYRTVFRDEAGAPVGAADADKPWTIQTRLSRFDGETFEIESTPDSAATLTAAMVRTLNFVGDPSAFGADALNPLLQEVSLFLAKFGYAITTDASDTDAGEGTAQESN